MPQSDRQTVERDDRDWPVGTSQATQEWLCQTVTMLLRKHEFLELHQLLDFLKHQPECPGDFRRAAIHDHDWLDATVERALRQVGAVEKFRLPPPRPR